MVLMEQPRNMYEGWRRYPNFAGCAVVRRMSTSVTGTKNVARVEERRYYFLPMK
jgi:hypothetical protein